MEVHLVDGTYELFRHFYGQAARGGAPSGRAAVRGVAATVLSLLEEGATPEQVAEMIGVALMLDGGPATVYGPRAWEAYLQFASPPT